MTAKAKASNVRLSDYLAQLIDESVKSALHRRALAEKEKQVAAGGEGGSDDLDNLFGSSGGGGEDKSNSGDSSGGDQQKSQPKKPADGEKSIDTSKTMDDEREKLEIGDIEPKDIIDKFNAIRSGRSFRDSGVADNLDKYLQSLSKSERVALFAFAKGISQIVTGEIPAQSAVDPGKHPADVDMEKTNEPHKVTKKPNVVKGPKSKKHAGSGQPGGEEPEAKKAPEEDTSAPAPITPKKRTK